jgi:hypothetical protein
VYSHHGGRNYPLVRRSAGASPLIPPFRLYVFQISNLQISHREKYRKEYIMAEKDRNRKHKLQVYLSDTETERLKQISAETDLPFSNIIRTFINHGKIDAFWMDEESKNTVGILNENIEKLYRDLIFEIGKVGNNINQIAYNTNVKMDAEVDDLKAAFNETVSLEQLMIEQLEALKQIVTDFELQDKVTKTNADHTHS